jgi:eukaryotic-like serine/threonine-protein kinase
VGGHSALPSPAAPALPTDGPAAQALRTHAALRAALQHPHIVQHLDGGIALGRVWLAYEWVSGADLTRYTKAAWLLPLPLVREVGLGLAAALDHAHRAGWLHRDLKPANVRVNLPQRVVKLTDFGIAKPTDSQTTMTGVLQGTPTYMAPEQLLGESPTARSDLYALGVLLYEMVSGRPPHTATTLQALLRQTSHGEAGPLAEHAPGVPGAWAELIHRLLAREPQRRPPDARAVLATLNELPAERPD